MWYASLSRFLLLADGRRLETLADARQLILSLPARDQAQDRWQRAAAMLMTAATTGRRDHIVVATGMIERAVTDPTRGAIAEKKPPARSIRRRTGAKKRA
jgi:hypothetical protein